jgi:hypothetical protein
MHVHSWKEKCKYDLASNLTFDWQFTEGKTAETSVSRETDWIKEVSKINWTIQSSGIYLDFYEMQIRIYSVVGLSL